MTTLAMENPETMTSMTAATPALAGRGARLGAALLDLLIFWGFLIPGLWIMLSSDSDMGKGFGVALLVVGWLGLLITQMVFLVKRGQSLGKMVVGIKIVRVSDGSVPGFVKVVLLRMFVPSLLAGIPYAGVLIWLGDALFIFRDDRRCLHDLIAETRVVDAQAKTPEASHVTTAALSEPVLSASKPVRPAVARSGQSATAADESDEDRIYAAIAKELEDGAQDKGLWTRLLAESDGDEKWTKVLYIKKRAERLMVAERMRRAQVEREQEAILLQERIKAQATDQLIQDTITRFKNGDAPTSDDVKLLARAATKDAQVALITERMHGNNLLHWCALLDLDDEAATLLRYGAYAHAPNGNGQKPFQLAHNLALAAVLKAAADRLGTCPNSRCQAVIPLISPECPKCGAFFGADSTWSVRPLET